jgi:hypothetical protein
MYLFERKDALREAMTETGPGSIHRNIPVILSAAKNLSSVPYGFFAALRMTVARLVPPW